MRDPSGLYARVPELLALAPRCAALRWAIGTGDPHAAYRALPALRRQLHGEELAAVEMLLSRRSLFLRPLPAAPSMHTVSGIGTTLHGHDDADDEAGTYVATLWVVFLRVPMLPLGQYLVSDAGRSSYRFYGQVPDGPWLLAWRRALWVLGAALLLAALYAGLEACALPRAVTE